MTEGQAVMFNCIVDNSIKRLQIETPTQYGKSLTTALALIYHRYIHKSKILIIAPKREQAQIIMDYITFHIYDRPMFAQGLDVESKQRIKTRKQAGRLVWEDGSEIRILTAGAGNSKTAGSGIMGFGADVIVTDESALIPDKIYSKILRMLGGNIEKSKLIKIGNPFHRNHFLKTHSEYDLFWVDYKQAIIEGRLSESFVGEMRENMDSEDFRVLYEVKYPKKDNKDGIISSTIIKNVLDLEFKGHNRKYVAGVDVARGGDDDTIITVISYVEGNEKLDDVDISDVQIEHQEMIKKGSGDLVLQSEEIEAILNRFKVHSVGVDVVGVGGGLADDLRHSEGLYDVFDFIAGGKSSNVRYANLKTDILYKIRALMIKGQLSLKGGNSVCVKNMVEYSKVRQSDKALRSVDPDDSPDWGDSLIIAVATALNYKDITFEIF